MNGMKKNFIKPSTNLAVNVKLTRARDILIMNLKGKEIIWILPKLFQAWNLYRRSAFVKNEEKYHNKIYILKGLRTAFKLRLEKWEHRLYLQLYSISLNSKSFWALKAVFKA